MFGLFGLSYEFRWSVLWIEPHLTWLFNGLSTTLRLAAISWVFAVLLGIIFGAMRTASFRPVRAIATVYVEFFRNVPLLVWLFFWYFGAPEAFPEGIKQWFIRHGIEFWSGVAAISIYHGARLSEVIRSGIQAIPKTQLEAGLSTGLSLIETYRLILIRAAFDRSPGNQRIFESSEKYILGNDHRCCRAHVRYPADRNLYSQGRGGPDCGSPDLSRSLSYYFNDHE